MFVFDPHPDVTHKKVTSEWSKMFFNNQQCGLSYKKQVQFDLDPPNLDLDEKILNSYIIETNRNEHSDKCYMN